MNRRHFLFAVLSSPFVAALKPQWNPFPLQRSFYGIDWGLNDATVGTWMGITRSTTPQFTPWIHEPRGRAIDKDLIALIRKMMDDAIADNQYKIDLATYAPQTVHKANHK